MLTVSLFDNLNVYCDGFDTESCDVTDVLNWEEVHRGLQEVLDSLKDVTNGHPSLHSADILHLSTSIIANVKGLFRLKFTL